MTLHNTLLRPVGLWVQQLILSAPGKKLSTQSYVMILTHDPTGWPILLNG